MEKIIDYKDGMIDIDQMVQDEVEVKNDYLKLRVLFNSEKSMYSYYDESTKNWINIKSEKVFKITILAKFNNVKVQNPDIPTVFYTLNENDITSFLENITVYAPYNGGETYDFSQYPAVIKDGMIYKNLHKDNSLHFPKTEQILTDVEEDKLTYFINEIIKTNLLNHKTDKPYSLSKIISVYDDKDANLNEDDLRLAKFLHWVGCTYVFQQQRLITQLGIIGDPGGMGKSGFFDMIMQPLLGENIYSSISVSDIQSSNGFTADMYGGKKLVFIDELSASKGFNPEQFFKEMGKSKITLNQKHGAKGSTANYANFCYASNYDHPFTFENSDRRHIIFTSFQSTDELEVDKRKELAADFFSNQTLVDETLVAFCKFFLQHEPSVEFANKHIKTPKWHQMNEMRKSIFHLMLEDKEFVVAQNASDGKATHSQKMATSISSLWEFYELYVQSYYGGKFPSNCDNKKKMQDQIDAMINFGFITKTPSRKYYFTDKLTSYRDGIPPYLNESQSDL